MIIVEVVWSGSSSGQLIASEWICGRSFSRLFAFWQAFEAVGWSIRTFDELRTLILSELMVFGKALHTTNLVDLLPQCRWVCWSCRETLEVIWIAFVTHRWYYKQIQISSLSLLSLTCFLRSTQMAYMIFALCRSEIGTWALAWKYRLITIYGFIGNSQRKVLSYCFQFARQAASSQLPFTIPVCS